MWHLSGLSAEGDASKGHYPGTSFPVTAPSSPPLPRSDAAARGVTQPDLPRGLSARPRGGCRASRPVAGPKAAGRGAAERQAEAPGGAQRRGGGSRLFAQSHHVDDASTAEIGAGSRVLRPSPLRPPAPRCRGGLASPPPPHTCVPDDDILEEIRVGHGRPIPGSPALARLFVTRARSPPALAVRARAAERWKRLTATGRRPAPAGRLRGHRSLPPTSAPAPAGSLGRCCPPAAPRDAGEDRRGGGKSGRREQ